MALEGTLSDMSLLDLFQVFAMGNKSGVLLLRQPKIWGVIYVYAGQLRDALVLKQPGRIVVESGEAAVLHMLHWPTAQFTFRHDLAVEQRPTRIVHHWQWLVQEAARQREHTATHTFTPNSASTGQHSLSVPVLHDALPTMRPQRQPTPVAITILPDSPLHLVQGYPSSSRTIKFSVDQWRVLSWIAQGSTARQIASTTGAELGDVLAIINELYSHGLVTILSAKWTAPADAISATTLQRRTPRLTAVLPERRIVEVVMRRIRGV